MILSGDETAYSDMKKAGRIVIEYIWEKGTQVIIDRFEYDGGVNPPPSHSQVMALVRDVLAAAVEADRLISGGRLVGVREIGQEEREADSC